jgi:hypothetical protein
MAGMRERQPIGGVGLRRIDRFSPAFSRRADFSLVATPSKWKMPSTAGLPISGRGHACERYIRARPERVAGAEKRQTAPALCEIITLAWSTPETTVFREFLST